MPFTKGNKINLGKRTGVYIYCGYCNTKSYKTQSQIKNGAKYCSVSCARKAHPPVWMHKNYTKERALKVSNSLKGKRTGESNQEWKGDRVQYRALHNWVNRWKGKANSCSNDLNHKSTRFHWANISQEYKRELNDWINLCPRCHKQYDKGRMVLKY